MTYYPRKNSNLPDWFLEFGALVDDLCDVRNYCKPREDVIVIVENDEILPLDQ